ncbi:MAG: glycosyltransferase [Thiobacillus sp.]|nr:glycosyltransferase [Thiobacillus sp.]
MHASIVVCTYNRADSLAHTLDCLKKQQLRADIDWEVIVVDNNSKDSTRTTVEAAMSGFPELRYEFESRQGLSHARNHGIDVASGDIVLFTDDDVCPEPDWVQVILDSMTKHGCDACGGYIAPVWEKQPPVWLTERFYGFLAIKTDTIKRQIMSTSDTPFGANMAFRRDLFARHGAFDVARGRMGNVLASGEDGELFERILNGGGKVMYFPRARVHHRVEAFRVEKAYFRRWRFQTSRNIAQNRGLAGERRLFNIPLYVFPQFMRAMARMLWGHLTQPRDEAFNREIVVFHFLGLIQGLYRAR